MALFTINISLSDSTLNALKTNGFNLYVFRSLEDSISTAAPLIMVTISDLAKNIDLKLPDSDYLGYISTQDLVEFKQIFINKPPVSSKKRGRPSTSRPAPIIISNTSIKVSLGELATIDQSGNLNVKNNAPQTNIQIRNASSQTYLTGLGSIIDDKSIPFSAQNIFPDQMLTIIPQSSFLVLFSDNKNYKNGTYLKTIDNRGMLITASTNETRKVTFDITTGWGNNSASWGERIASGTDLEHILINQQS